MKSCFRCMEKTSQDTASFPAEPRRALDAPLTVLRTTRLLGAAQRSSWVTSLLTRRRHAADTGSAAPQRGGGARRPATGRRGGSGPGPRRASTRSSHLPLATMSRTLTVGPARHPASPQMPCPPRPAPAGPAQLPCMLMAPHKLTISPDVARVLPVVTRRSQVTRRPEAAGQR